MPLNSFSFWSRFSVSIKSLNNYFFSGFSNKSLLDRLPVLINYIMWSSNHFSISSCFHVFQGPGFLRSRFFRVQNFQCPGFFRVQLFQGPCPGFRSSLNFWNFQSTLQRRIKVVSTSWINVEITLICRSKWNKFRGRIFSLAKLWYNVGVRRRCYYIETTLRSIDAMVYQLCTTLFQCYFNIDMTLSQRCFKVTSTLVKAILKPIGIVIVWFCL